MIDNVAYILQRECKIHARNLLLVGVSGGPDSLCLMHVLHELGYPMIVAHLNHSMRPEADEETSVVKQYASDLGIDFISQKVDVPSYAREHSISTEEAARTIRYQYLFEQAEVAKAYAVVVGHNADDQVETILMHLLRGAGLVGLRGMEYRVMPTPWSTHIPLLRPLLSTWRKEIVKYLEEHKLIPITDHSNLDTTFFRNRVRNELVPILEGYSPRFRENLLRLGHISMDDYSVLEQLVTQAWNENLTQQGSGYLAFNRSGYLELPISIQRYLLRRAIAYHLPGLIDVDFDCIERGIEFLSDDKPSGQADLICGLRIIKEGGTFWLVAGTAELPDLDYPMMTAGIEYTVRIPSTISLNDNWVLQAEEITDPDTAIHHRAANLNLLQAWLDISNLESNLIVRTRKSGDHIQPLGMKGHSIKISDLMINLKLPVRRRTTWPLVCAGDEVLWVPGYRLSHLAQVTPNSRVIVHLSLSRNLTT